MLCNFRSNLLAFGLAAIATAAASGMTVTLTPSASSPAPLGTVVTFSAAASAASGSNLWYRYRVRRPRGEYQIIRDYAPLNTLDWTASKFEGLYEMEVSARDLDSGDQAVATSSFQFQPLVTGSQPVVTPTSNSLVFLYSAPPCRAGSRMRVQFQPAAGGASQFTPFLACASGLSTNFYLAGLLPKTAYTAHHIIDTGFALATGPDVAFTTGDVPAGLYTDSILIPARNPSPQPILLGGPLAAHPVANDLAGNVLWYGPAGMTFITRAEAGGLFWGIVETPGANSPQQVVRQFDLTGMTVLETNAARVSEQLRAMGKRAITAFHHEARTISGGRIAVLAGVEQVMTDVQGPGPVDVLGDMIVVLDKDLNVVWAWDTFDNLDVTRMAVLGEVCPGAGCPSYYLATAANDWTHGNAIQETPDGNFLYSTRNQDWLIKISYDHGNGDGHIVWRLGNGGDFRVVSSDAFPWFSHQHDGSIQIGNSTRLMVFDDGNTRVAQMQGGNSRGQAYDLDEQNKVATPVLNADLGVYALAVGSAQLLRNGNYHFDAGFVQENGTTDSYSIEVDPSGAIQYEAHQNVILYRTFRMADMYTPD